jgi:hypothetical protein
VGISGLSHYSREFYVHLNLSQETAFSIRLHFKGAAVTELFLVRIYADFRQVVSM